MTKNRRGKTRRGKTRSKTQRGGVWYNPLTWFESENDSPYGQSSSNSGFFSSAMNNVDNMATGLTNSVTNSNYYNSSLRLNTGDKIHVLMSYTGGNANTAHDITLQLDIF